MWNPSFGDAVQQLGPGEKKEGSRRLVLDFESFQGLYKAKASNHSKLQPLRGLFSIILYLGFVLVKKNMGFTTRGRKWCDPQSDATGKTPIFSHDLRRRDTPRDVKLCCLDTA